MQLKTNLKTMGLTLTAIIIILTFCSSVGNDTKGTISGAKKILKLKTGGEVIGVELIHTEHINKWIRNNGFEVDGAVFWKGFNKKIPAHDILYFRGYSDILESYVFLQFNDEENTKNYYMMNIYNKNHI